LPTNQFNNVFGSAVAQKTNASLNKFWQINGRNGLNTTDYSNTNKLHIQSGVSNSTSSNLPELPVNTHLSQAVLLPIDSGIPNTENLLAIGANALTIEPYRSYILDVVRNEWLYLSKYSFPEVNRRYAAGFSIGKNAYIIGGTNNTEFNPIHGITNALTGRQISIWKFELPNVTLTTAIATTSENKILNAGAVGITNSSLIESYGIQYKASNTTTWLDGYSANGSPGSSFIIPEIPSTNLTSGMLYDYVPWVAVDGYRIYGTVRSIATEVLVALSINPTSNNVSFNSTSFPVTVESTTNWTAESTVPWMDVSPSFGSAGTTVVTVSVDPNFNIGTRIGDIFFTPLSGFSQYCTVTQDGNGI
jgi:hypothetical protein